MTTTTKDSYLTLVGEDEAVGRDASASDNEDVSIEEDVSVSPFAKISGDYLIPFV